MKRTEPQSLGDILRLAMEENRMHTRLMEVEAGKIWPEIVGEYIAGCTERVDVKQGVMAVAINSAPLRHELVMSRSSLISSINKRLGEEIITEIKFLSN